MSGMEKFGEALKSERQQKSISLEEISEKTNLNVNILKALEEDDFSNIPGKFYYMRFIEQYLRVLEIDKKSFLEKNSPDYREDEDETTRVLYSKLSYSRFRKKSFITLLAFVLLLIASGYVLTVYYDFKLPENFSIFKEEQHVLPPVYADFTSMIPEHSVDTAPVKVVLEFKDNCWISISRSGTIVDQALHRKGEKVEVEGYSLKITLGNPAGVKMSVNGTETKWLNGKKGTVQMQLEPGTLADYLVKE